MTIASLNEAVLAEHECVRELEMASSSSSSPLDTGITLILGRMGSGKTTFAKSILHGSSFENVHIVGRGSHLHEEWRDFFPSRPKFHRGLTEGIQDDVDGEAGRGALVIIDALGWIPPLGFLRHARESGLTVVVMAGSITEFCRHLRRWASVLCLTSVPHEVAMAEVANSFLPQMEPELVASVVRGAIPGKHHCMVMQLHHETSCERLGHAYPYVAQFPPPAHCSRANTGECEKQVLPLSFSPPLEDAIRRGGGGSGSRSITAPPSLRDGGDEEALSE